jgi:hypothetical protein
MKTIKAKVHRLPTKEKGAWICKRKSDGYLEYVGKGYGNAQNSAWTDLHLYITTDEEIKEGDWIYADGGTWNGTITQCKESLLTECWRKIIASTDLKLIADGVAEIKQSFIEEYCKAGGIDEVLVEYVLNPTRHTHLKPRTINNTIIIHPVEENKFEKQKTYILRRLEHCNKRLKQCEEKYNGKEEKHTFHGGRVMGYWLGLVEGYTLQLEWIEENL